MQTVLKTEQLSYLRKASFGCVLLMLVVIMHSACLSSRSNIVGRIREACLEGDVEKIDEFLSYGFPIDAAICDNGDTLLHKAAIYQDERMLRFLMAKNASLTITNKYGYRPIDEPHSLGLTNICELLVDKSPKPDQLIDNIPEPVLERIFDFYGTLEKKTVLTLNHAQPSPDIVKWLIKRGLYRFATRHCEFEMIMDSDSGFKEWRDKLTGDTIWRCNVDLTKRSETMFEWDRSIWFSPAPSKIDPLVLVGFKMYKEYGYWFSN